jgi:hypothetical protein
MKWSMCCPVPNLYELVMVFAMHWDQGLPALKLYKKYFCVMRAIRDLAKESFVGEAGARRRHGCRWGREEDAGTVHVEGGACDFWHVADENSVGA